jgi:hypothetical protein
MLSVVNTLLDDTQKTRILVFQRLNSIYGRYFFSHCTESACMPQCKHEKRRVLFGLDEVGKHEPSPPQVGPQRR